MMKWHFPLARFAKKYNVKKQIRSILNEIAEFEEETDLDKKASEVVDVLHSAETLVRMFFLKYPLLSFSQKKIETIQKNKKRGYYR